MPGTLPPDDADRLQSFTAPDSGLPRGPSPLDIAAQQARDLHAVIRQLRDRAPGQFAQASFEQLEQERQQRLRRRLQ